MPNRLALETSPYLLQHKDNPVDWYAWGDEAFATARTLDKPVLLSVGYSACHWCHVMEHESFENEGIAALMNDLFVSIKVDREERPDIDAVYMAAVQALNRGNGGWPMTVFLTPDGVPFFGGTYYPPEDRRGMPGFPRVLQAVADAYKERRSDVATTADQVLDVLKGPSQLAGGSALLTPQSLDDAFRGCSSAFDPAFGGFGRAPKFPPAMTLDFLMRYYKRTGNADALSMTEKTLVAMAHGGMYDQVGGGFHRYSTDAVWLVPHFEKMLYDNALLARAYLDAWRLTKQPLYHRIVEETLDYVRREMTDPAGGFYSTQDADSEGEEGKFFLWNLDELKAVLGEDADLVASYFGATAEGNFEGRNILHVAQDPQRFAAEHGLTPEALDDAIEAAKAKLFAAREPRIRPARDDKVLTAWNGLMLRAFAEAAFAFDSAAHRETAVRNADFLIQTMWRDGRLLRSWKDGVAKIPAYLEDYAMLIDGLIATYSATFESRFLRAAIVLADEMIDLFWDDGAGAFYDTGRDAEALITRPRDLFDNATPSGTSVATDVLLRLAALTGNDDYERRATAVQRALSPYIEQAPTAFGRLLAALDYHLSASQELAIVWPAGESPDTLLAPIRDAYLPHLLLVGALEGVDADLTPLLQDRPAVGSMPTAYVCEHFVCQMPTTDPSVLREQLGLT